jgi:hypothetical protein
MANTWRPGTSPWEHVIELDSGWQLTLHVAPDDQERYVVDGVHIDPPDDLPPGGIGVGFWRSIPIGRLAAEAVDAINASQEDWIDEVYRERDKVSEAFKQRPGPEGHPLYLYALLAQHYVMQWQVGDRKAAEATANWYGMKRATFARRLHEARRRGLLTSEGKGSAGGQLTALAQQRIDSEEAKRFLTGED